jgi:hypothetical protein
MLFDGDPIAAADQAAEEMRQFARVSAVYFDALMRAGFAADEAMELLMHWHAMYSATADE